MSTDHPDLNSVDTVCKEGADFAARHPELNDTQRSIGALTWGLLRALYECPNCPGYFREPCHPTLDGVPIPGEHIGCRRCNTVWTWSDSLPTEPAPAAKRRGKKR